MNLKRHLLIVGLVVGASLTVAHSQEAPPQEGQSRESPPPGGEPKDFTLAAKETFQLDNGMGAVLVPYGTLPKVTARVVVRAGNLNEAADEVWLADLTGRMMSEGTASLDAKALAARFAGMGGELEINTTLDTTTIEAAVLSEFAGELVRLLADVARNPAFPESELNRVKGDMERELTIARTRPQPLANEAFYALLYGDHPYGRLYPTPEMLAGYDLSGVRGFHDDNFGARRSKIYVVGRFDEESVETAIRESFGDWAEGPEVLINIPEMNSSRQITLIDRPGAPQSTLRLGLPTVDPSHEDYLEMEVMNTLLGGSFSSRITSNIREDKGYTYSPRSQVSERVRAAHWVQSADVTTEHTGDSFQEIFYEIDRLQSEPPTEDELRGIHNYMAGVFVLGNSSQSGIINQLSFVDLHGLDDSYLTGYVGTIFGVDAETVSATASRYLRQDEMSVVVVGDKAQVEPQLATVEEIAR